MRMIEKLEGTCDPCPEITGLQRPSGGLLADVYIRGNHMGANVWIFTVYSSLANAQAETSPAGVAGSEFPEESGQWPLSNNPPYPPNTTDWALLVTLPGTAPSGTCYTIWRWSSDYAGKAAAAVCTVLSEYTGPGKALEGATVQCGTPGEQHPSKIVWVVPDDAAPKVSPRTYSGRGVLLRIGLRVGDLPQAEAVRTAQMMVASIAAIVSERRVELSGNGRVEFSAVQAVRATPGYYEADLVFESVEVLTREG